MQFVFYEAKMWKFFLFSVLFAFACLDTVSTAGDKITLYSLTQKSPEFIPKELGFNAKKDGNSMVGTTNPAVKHQTITGFGGTFSDATGINLNKASPEIRSKILKLLFSGDGIGLTLCRVPIGSTEYSKRAYTLDDHEGDTTLKQFALQEEDLVHKVRTILNLL